MGLVDDVYVVRKHVEALNDTWGHLKPAKGQAYSGYILYTVGCYGDIVCIESRFEELNDSPWFYEDLHDFMGDRGEINGIVYLFTGTYCRDRESKFLGIFKRMDAATVKNRIEES